MKNRFLGMKTGFQTRPDRPRPRKTQNTDRKLGTKTGKTKIIRAVQHHFRPGYETFSDCPPLIFGSLGIIFWDLPILFRPCKSLE